MTENFKMRRATALMAEAVKDAPLEDVLALIGALCGLVVERFPRPPANLPGSRALHGIARLFASCLDGIRCGDQLPTLRMFAPDGTDITDTPAPPRRVN